MPCVHTRVSVYHVHTFLLFISHCPLLSTRHPRHVSFLRAEPAEPSSLVNLPGLPGFGSSTLQPLVNTGLVEGFHPIRSTLFLFTCGCLDPTLTPTVPYRVGTAALSTFGVSPLVQNSFFPGEVQVSVPEVYLSIIVLPDC